LSLVRRILDEIKGKKEDKGTISYGETVQVEHRRKNWERRLETLRKTIACNRPEGPCEKMSLQECAKCKYLSSPHEMLKIAFITSQSHGEIGERYPITPDNHEAWNTLYMLYVDYQSKFGPNHPIVQRLSRYLNVIDSSFAFRSTTKEHTRTDVASPTELLQLLQALLGIQGASKFPVDMLGTKKE